MTDRPEALRGPQRAVAYAALAVVGLAVALPLLWMAASSLKTTRELFASPFALPADPQWGNYAQAWERGVGRYLLNSLVVTALSVAGILALTAPAAYALARLRVPFRRALYVLLITGYAVPVYAVLVPLYELLRGAGLLDQYAGLVLPYVAFGVPFSVLLLYAHFRDFPKELEEAARLDGLGDWGVFRRVVVPLSMPALLSVALFQSVFVFNEFLLALVLIADDARKTLPLGLTVFQGQFAVEWPLVLAAATTATLPFLALFLAIQRRFVQSLTGFGK